MFDQFRTMFGGVTIKETSTEIVVSGIRAKDIVRDMDKYWKTTRITQNIFNTVSGNSFSFFKFFAPEITYILENVKNYRHRWTSVRAINGIVEGMMEHTWLKNTIPPDTTTIEGRLDYRKLTNLRFTPKPYQMEYFKNYSYRLDQYGLKGDLLAAAAGTGKAQPLDASIKIPGGWKRMGDMKVGDIVTAWDGTPTNVIGVYPQGRRQTFTVHFTDGRVVEACDEHLWRIYHENWARTGDGWKIVTTMELFAYLQSPSYQDRMYVQLCKSEDTPDQPLPLDPYNLGVLLGDGSISQDVTKFSSVSECLVARFASKLPADLELVKRDHITYSVVRKARDINKGHNQYTQALREMQLLGRTSVDKFIPEIYLHGSHIQRLELIKGLMDTDGSISLKGGVNYTTISYKLATQIQYLVRSLGGIATITHRDPTYTYNGEKRIGQTAYTVNIRIQDSSILFTIPEKVERTRFQTKELKLRISHVNLSKVVETQCISVEHPDHLYITNDFVVTHNTYTMSAIAEMLGAELIVVFCPKAVLESVWVDSVNEMFKSPQSIWHSGKPMVYEGQRWIICHYDAIPKLMDIFQNPDTYQGKKIVTILDESHNMNDPNSARSLQYQSIVKLLGSDNNIQGSGTPVKALGAELITLLRVVDPLFTPQVEAIFKKIYGKEASKGLDIIRHRLGLVSYKVEKSEADESLLPPIMRPYPIKVPDGDRFTLPAIRKVMEAFIKERTAYYQKRRPEDMKFWEDCIKIARSGITDREARIQFDEYLHLVHLISRTPDPRYLGEEMKRANAFEKNVFEKLLPQKMISQFRDVKSVVKYVNLKIQGEVLGRIVGGMRIEANVAMVPYIDWVGIVESTVKKTIMFTSFVEAVDAAEAHTIKLGMKPLVVYGKNTNDLANHVKRFDTDPTLNPLLATYASLSTGVRLTIADTMILLNSPFRAYILEQAISRIYRLGQDSQTYVYQCTLDTGEVPNISTRSADILAWSQSQVEEILGVKSPFVEGETFEMAAMEHIKAGEFDDNKIFYAILNKAFEKYDIAIDINDFIKPLELKPLVPAWAR